VRASLTRSEPDSEPLGLLRDSSSRRGAGAAHGGSRRLRPSPLTQCGGQAARRHPRKPSGYSPHSAVCERRRTVPHGLAFVRRLKEQPRRRSTAFRLVPSGHASRNTGPVSWFSTCARWASHGVWSSSSSLQRVIEAVRPSNRRPSRHRARAARPPVAKTDRSLCGHPSHSSKHVARRREWWVIPFRVR
jgi:hypothetical protein